MESIKNEIISESQRLSNECLDDTKKQNDESWIQTVKLRQSKMRNQTCYMLTQQEVMISHLQIEQETVPFLIIIKLSGGQKVYIPRWASPIFWQRRFCKFEK